MADTVAAVDLQGFYAPYEGDGRRNQPFDPQMMVTVLLYAYATGTFSSRRIARKLEEDVAYRVLAAGNFPAHRTIAEFRQQHLAAFEALFVQVVAIAREAGVVQVGAVAVDGSKVKASASKRKAMSYGRMRDEERRLREQIAALTTQAEATDAAEDAGTGRPSEGTSCQRNCSDASSGWRPSPRRRRASKRGKRTRIGGKGGPRTMAARGAGAHRSPGISVCRLTMRRTISPIPRVGS